MSPLRKILLTSFVVYGVMLMLIQIALPGGEEFPTLLSFLSVVFFTTMAVTAVTVTIDDLQHFNVPVAVATLASAIVWLLIALADKNGARQSSATLELGGYAVGGAVAMEVVLALGRKRRKRTRGEE